ncbi:MAG TPA: hypothetical protein VGY98_11965 [Verrucomicrobiae bacterium]|nr:hypothetical protein [Verrucomicrobiae bacterium]
MKKAILLFLALVIAVVAILAWFQVSNSRKAAALSPVNTIVRVYFAGGDNLAADTNSTAFTNIFCCSQARALEDQTLDKLSRAPAAWFADKLPAGASNGAAQLRPLLDDFLKSKWVFQMQDAPASPEYALAIDLNDARAQLWQTNLRSLLESWTGIKAQDIAGGWELKKDMPPNLFRIVRSTNWLVIGCGQDELPLSDAWAHGALSPDTNETNWASARINWPRLAQVFPHFAKFDLPAMQMQVAGRGGNLLPSGTFELSQPMPALGDWQIPSDMIHGPLTSFTAIRGFGPWLQRRPWAKLLELSPEPDQAFIWSSGQVPLQSYLAVPVSNSVSALAQLGQNLTADTNWESGLLYYLPMERKTNSILLKDVPFYVSPEVKALTDPSGDYLFAEVFPNVPGSEPPEALMQEVTRENRVFYHWEVTPQRLKDLPRLTQLALVLSQHRQLDQGSTAGKWLNRIGPTLGDSVTEVTEASPSKLTFTRSAPAGLTAIELLGLAEWLEAPNFPDCDMRAMYIPKPLPHKKPRIPQMLNPPMQHPPSTNQPPQPAKTKQ